MSIKIDLKKYKLPERFEGYFEITVETDMNYKRDFMRIDQDRRFVSFLCSKAGLISCHTQHIDCLNKHKFEHFCGSLYIDISVYDDASSRRNFIRNIKEIYIMVSPEQLNSFFNSYEKQIKELKDEQYRFTGLKRYRCDFLMNISKYIVQKYGLEIGDNYDKTNTNLFTVRDFIHEELQINMQLGFNGKFKDYEDMGIKYRSIENDLLEMISNIANITNIEKYQQE